MDDLKLLKSKQVKLLEMLSTCKDELTKYILEQQVKDNVVKMLKIIDEDGSKR